MSLTFSKKIKTALSVFLVLTSALAASSSFASRRGRYYDTINILPEGKITGYHSEGDIRLDRGKANSSFIIAYRYAAKGCPSGTSYKEYYYTSRGPCIIIKYCAGDGTASITYTTNTGKVCHITLIDSADRKNAAIQSVDCDYSYALKLDDQYDWFLKIDKSYSQLELNTAENPTDISGM